MTITLQPSNDGMSLLCMRDNDICNRYPDSPCVHIVNAIIYDTDPKAFTDGSVQNIWLPVGGAAATKDLQWLGWTKVRIDTMPTGINSKVSLVHSPITSAGIKREFLGIIDKNEGRRVISSMVMDYVLSRMHKDDKWNEGKPLKTKCLSRMHSYRQEKFKLEQELVIADRSRMMMMIALALENTCIPCLRDAYGGDIEDDDDYNFGLGDSDTSNKLSSREARPRPKKAARPGSGSSMSVGKSGGDAGVPVLNFVPKITEVDAVTQEAIRQKAFIEILEMGRKQYGK